MSGQIEHIYKQKYKHRWIKKKKNKTIIISVIILYELCQ